MTRLQVSQKFRFTKIQSGIIYYHENNGLGPYAVPARYYTKEIKIAKFLGSRDFVRSEIMEVVEAHNAVDGWHVVAKLMSDVEVRVSFFQQIEEEGIRFVKVNFVNLES